MVWNTTQSSYYEAERRGGDNSPRGNAVTYENRAARQTDKREPPCAEERGERTAPPRDEPRRPPEAAPKKGLFEDGDALLMFALLMILMREKADRKLIYSLLFVLFM